MKALTAVVILCLLAAAPPKLWRPFPDDPLPSVVLITGREEHNMSVQRSKPKVYVVHQWQTLDGTHGEAWLLKLEFTQAKLTAAIKAEIQKGRRDAWVKWEYRGKVRKLK